MSCALSLPPPYPPKNISSYFFFFFFASWLLIDFSSRGSSDFCRKTPCSPKQGICSFAQHSEWSSVGCHLSCLQCLPPPTPPLHSTPNGPQLAVTCPSCSPFPYLLYHCTAPRMVLSWPSPAPPAVPSPLRHPEI